MDGVNRGQRDQPSRAVVTSASRPLKVAVVLPQSPGSRRLRETVRALCSVWGGARSAIVTGTRAAPIDPAWLPVLKGLDPDVVYVHRELGGVAARASVRRFLDERGMSPIWVLPLSSGLDLPTGWRL